MDDAQFMKVAEVADRLGVCRSRAYTLVRRGFIPVVRIGPHSFRVPRAAFEAWVQGRVKDALMEMQAVAEAPTSARQ